MKLINKANSENYNLIKRDLRIPENAKKVTTIFSADRPGYNREFYIWKNKNSISFFPLFSDKLSVDHMKILEIPLSRIDSFGMEGESGIKSFA